MTESGKRHRNSKHDVITDVDKRANFKSNPTAKTSSLMQELAGQLTFPINSFSDLIKKITETLS